MSLRSPLVEQVLAGDNRQLQLLAAQGLLPLPPGELIPLQVALAHGHDSELAEHAGDALRALPPATLVAHLAEDADHETLRHFAAESTHPAVLEAILRRRDTPRDLMASLAPTLGPDLQEVLVLRQDAILELPRIIDQLESNPQLSQYTLRRILEYREHLLPRGDGPARVELIPALADPDVREAVIEAKKLPTSGDQDEELGLSEGQVRALPVPVKLKLARGAPRMLRSILVKDSNTLVALTVLESNPISDQEVEQIAASRQVSDDVLDFVARRSDWIRRYPVRLALVANPKTSPGIAVRLMASLAVRDLRNLSRDRNVPDVVRTGAQRLYRIKAT